MTLFEYLSVAISVILSLSAAQLLSSLRSVFDPARRYWIHALYIAQMLFLHVLNWWSFWAYREVESWNLGSFSFVLFSPALIFVCSNALVSTPAPGEIGWVQHFEKTRKWFFALRILLVLHTWTRAWYFLDRPILDTARLGGVAVILLFIAGIVSSDRRVQGTVVVATTILLFWLGYARFEIGSW